MDTLSVAWQVMHFLQTPVMCLVSNVRNSSPKITKKKFKYNALVFYNADNIFQEYFGSLLNNSKN